MILEEFGLEEWNEDLLGPAPTETEEWTEEDWNAYDEEMDEIWEEEMEDPIHRLDHPGILSGVDHGVDAIELGDDLIV